MVVNEGQNPIFGIFEWPLKVGFTVQYVDIDNFSHLL